MSLRSSKFLSKRELQYSKLNHRFDQTSDKRIHKSKPTSKIPSRKIPKSHLLRLSQKENNALRLRIEGLAYKKRIKSEILHRNQMLDFWSGAWNKKLLIHPESLEHLSRFIEYRINTTQQLFSKQDSYIEYHSDSIIAWLFYQWLLLSKNNQNQPIPEQLPLSLQLEFFHSMDLAKHIPMLLNRRINKQSNSKAPPEKYFIQDSKEFKSELSVLKAQFSKALSEGLLNACLDEESQKVIFGRTPRNSQIEELFTTTNLLIDFGNHLGLWDLCFINSIIRPFHETNPFSDANEWKRALRFEQTVNAIEAVHEHHIDDIEFLHARVVTSLMLESYILDETLLKSVLQSLNSPHQLQRIGDQLLIWIAQEGKPSRLVFISNLTQLYYRQYLAACLKQKQSFQLKHRFPGSSFYKAIGLSPDTVKLRTFKSWKHSIKAYLQLKGYLSGMGLAYVSGDIQSHPFLPKVLNRFFNLNATTEETSIHAENSPDHGRLPRSLLWTQLRSALDVNHIKTSEEYDIRQGIKQRIHHLIANPLFSNNERLVARYALARIDKSHGFNALSPSAILRHIDAFGLPIILSAEDFSLLELLSVQRQAIYLNAIEMKSINPNRFLYFLKIFEDWLTNKWQDAGASKAIETIPDYDELFGDVKRPECSVDANVLSFEEYEQAKQLLIQAYTYSEGQRLEFLQATILLILGFKLDLRRSEAIYLHSKDYVFDPEQANLFVKPHEKRTLKTNNANRMYHLEEHLTPEEMQLFTEYLGAVGRNLKTQEMTYLFPDKKTTPCPPNRIINPLLQVLRQVSGDAEFKFHNLRHSKASWDLLAIFNAQFGLRLENTIFKHMPETAQFLSDAKKRWANAVHTEESFHKAPFYLHRQMGHGSLITTLKNYIHTMDFVTAGLQQRHLEQKLKIEWASSLGVVHKSTLYKKLESKEQTIQEYLLEKILPWSTFEQSKNEESKQESESTESPPSPEALTTLGSKISSGTLLPRQELRKWKAFCLFEIFHLSLENQGEELLLVLKRLNLKPENLPKILEYFGSNKRTRFKMPVHDASFNRLIDEFLKLPTAWQKSVLNENFFTSDDFESERLLITHTISRISVKLQDTKAPFSLAKEMDIICGNPDEAHPVIELIRILGWKIECRFMSPQKGDFSWRDWKKELLLEDAKLNEDSVVTAKVKNSHGRMTIRLKREGKSSSKHSERYLLLALLSIQIDFT